MKSDLGVRTLSAIVMLAVAGGALWLGGWWLTAFIALVAFVAFVELALLVLQATDAFAARLAGVIAGALYISAAVYSLAMIGRDLIAFTVMAVILTDTCAYFAGRAIGGPRIAPSISPSKTWAGLFGGMLGAAIGAGLWNLISLWSAHILVTSDGWGFIFNSVVMGAFGFGALLALVAQAGDFFESWLKRKAGVKDSSQLIPGHGGVFDRIDGLVPAAIVSGWYLGIWGLA